MRLCAELVNIVPAGTLTMIPTQVRGVFKGWCITFTGSNVYLLSGNCWSFLTRNEFLFYIRICVVRAVDCGLLWVPLFHVWGTLTIHHHRDQLHRNHVI